MDQLSQATLTELRTLFEGLSKTSTARPDDAAQNAGDSEDRLTVQFAKLRKRLDEILSEVADGSDAYYKVVAMKHSLTYEEAKIHLNRNETEMAQEYLEKTLEGLLEHKQHPQLAFLYIRIVNHLAYLLSKKGELERARALLEEVTTNKTDDLIVFSSEELFYNKTSDETQAVGKLGKLMANNLQMLGWVYGKIGNHDMYTQKLHEALQQLLDVYDNDLVQWSCRCIRLALLFLNKCQYVPARYHLSAAGTVLDSLEATMSVHPDLGKAQADLARCWIHYSLHLFGTSKKVILERMCKEAEAQSCELFKKTGGLGIES